MRYEMKQGPYGMDMYDNDLDEFLNEVECVEKMNEQDKELQSIKKQIRDKYRNANDVFGLSLGVEK